jgi:hypothetical protein
MGDMTTIEAKYQELSSRLDEAALRLWAVATVVAAESSPAIQVGSGLINLQA